MITKFLICAVTNPRTFSLLCSVYDDVLQGEKSVCDPCKKRCPIDDILNDR